MAPAWAIRWTAAAFRDIERLDPAVARRTLAAIERAARDPPRAFSRLVGHDDYKLRVGDWRVLALLSFEEKTVIIERVAHRSHVYRR